MPVPRPVRRARGAFSLIELLIVVAIIAALVGVAVPFFQNNINEANRAKAQQDLDIVQSAINRYYYKNQRFLLGTSLGPLLSGYMNELPKDPWGNDYLYDGAIGLLMTYGADGLPGGEDGDSDVFRRIVPVVEIRRVQYQGTWGPPSPELNAAGVPVFNELSRGNAILVTLTKPIDEVEPATVPDYIELLRNVDTPDGSPIALEAAYGTPPADPWLGGTWVSAGNPVIPPGWERRHRPEEAVLVFRCAQNNRTNPGFSGAQSLTPTMAMDFSAAVSSATATIKESYYVGADPASPMDENVFGTEAYQMYKAVVQSTKPVSGYRRGIKIQKY